MKFKFKIQQYQTEAVEQTVNVFSGQKSVSSSTYRRDLGNTSGRIVYEEEYTGYKNADISLSRADLLDNIQKCQAEGNIKQSDKLIVPDGLGACSLDIEMETGTGKTYVYIKTMFELNKRYGWTKFIVVVPSIAIREGVQKVSKCSKTTSWSNMERKLVLSYIIAATLMLWTISPVRQAYR